MSKIEKLSQEELIFKPRDYIIFRGGLKIENIGKEIISFKPPTEVDIISEEADEHNKEEEPERECNTCDILTCYFYSRKKSKECDHEWVGFEGNDGYKYQREDCRKCGIKKPQSKKWKPEEGEKYWLIDENCFKTKAEAEQARDKIKELLTNLK
jgi:hypothetical protein